MRSISPARRRWWTAAMKRSGCPPPTRRRSAPWARWAPRWVPWLRRVAGMLAVLVMAVMAWQGWIAARDSAAFNDVTSDLALPRLWYWIPVLAGMVGAGIAAAAMLFAREPGK